MSEVSLPCDQALLAATLALMTAFAGPAPSAHRRLIAHKIVSNLFFLSQHPGLSQGMRQVVSNVQRHWTTLVAGLDGTLDTGVPQSCGDEDRLCHTPSLH